MKWVFGLFWIGCRRWTIIIIYKPRAPSNLLLPMLFIQLPPKQTLMGAIIYTYNQLIAYGKLSLANNGPRHQPMALSAPSHPSFVVPSLLLLRIYIHFCSASAVALQRLSLGAIFDSTIIPYRVKYDRTFAWAKLSFVFINMRYCVRRLNRTQYV